MSDIDTTNSTEQDQETGDEVTVMVHPDAPGRTTRVGPGQVKLMESVGWRAQEDLDKPDDAPPVRGDQPDGNPVADEAPAPSVAEPDAVASEAAAPAGEQAPAGDAGTTENDPTPKRRR